jgi:hypothetical protein
MTKFSDHLWDDLLRAHGPDLAQAHRPQAGRGRLVRRRGVLAGSTLGLAGVGTALVLALGAASNTPAYAVTTSSNGAVLVTINEGSSLPQANAKLTAMGIDEQVIIYVAPGAAAVSGPVSCQRAPADLSGPPVQVLLGADGTESIVPGQTAGNTGVGTYHLDHCVVTGSTPAGDSGNTGAA